MTQLAIICVDDEKIILDSLQNELQSILEKDLILELAESGEEAISVINDLEKENIMPAVVVSDQIMPGLKGDELLIKLHEKHPEIQKILLTGQADADAVGNVVNNAQLYRYIAKPWEKMDFKMTIQEAVSKYQSEIIVTEQKRIIENLRVNIVENFITSKEIKLDDQQLYKKIFFQRFIRQLSKHTKEWFINACLGLINMDRKVTNANMIFLSAIVSENKDKQFVHEILSKMKGKVVPEMENLQTKNEMALNIIKQLALILIENKKITTQESNYFLDLCRKLGIEKQSVKQIIELAKQEIVLNYEKQKHFKNLEGQPQVFGAFG